MKFTEEQYQNIIKATKDIVNSGDMRLMGTNASISVHSKLYATDKVNQLPFRELENEIMAIVNPLTREWAHDKFVEKEKKYYWKLNGLFLVKAMSDGSLYFNQLEDADLLSDSEIREWGFNPEMFDREEVQ